ncbi:signal peptidase I [Roseisolibacter sp. H3M3-2]|uniref:signal peptidase I n=1 Tax=Roseisolibacter sp. H3M3-2 TaxID=3031323 RepID=UPI0023DC0814|nr:signal peptidase I [Roseisolibacter sp. H3M3-2]MDF1503104.1 signal peptidase I [Roseisolibacter sp. H3M3-2]
MELGTGALPADAEAEPRVSAAARAAALDQVNRGARLSLGWFWEWSKVFILAVALFVFVRAFLVEAYKIPSGSMEGTLLVGDFLLVDKLVYGAAVPLTGSHLPRLRAPSRGDVVVFQWPTDTRKNFVKRLVGLPGDTLAMRAGVLFVNGAAQQERYATHTEPGADPSYEDFRWQRDFALRDVAPRRGGPRDAWAEVPRPATLDEGLEAGGAGVAIAARAPSARPNRNPGDHPSRNNWGPLVVPARSFFVLGDNRDNSLDSRYWGFVPDSLLRGRPLLVYYSYAPDSARRLDWLTAVRWSRLGARVR